MPLRKHSSWTALLLMCFVTAAASSSSATDAMALVAYMALEPYLDLKVFNVSSAEELFRKEIMLVNDIDEEIIDEGEWRETEEQTDTESVSKTNGTHIKTETGTRVKRRASESIAQEDRLKQENMLNTLHLEGESRQNHTSKNSILSDFQKSESEEHTSYDSQQSSNNKVIMHGGQEPSLEKFNQVQDDHQPQSVQEPHLPSHQGPHQPDWLRRLGHWDPWRSSLDRQRRSEENAPVMYMSLGPASSAELCPSVADSSAVSLSQMAFLSMTVSLFSVVATIANNLNNNNNNNNDNNLNFVHQQNNNLNMNQNIVNQLNINLPPPVPGKRAAEQNWIMEKIRSLKENPPMTSDCRSDDLSPDVAEAILDVLAASIGRNVEVAASRQCLARELCMRSVQSASPESASSSSSSVPSVLYSLQTLALLYMELGDKSESFASFLDSVDDRRTISAADCVAMFPECGLPKELGYAYVANAM